jgi:hypothetical protein
MINISDYIETAYNAAKTVMSHVYLDRPKAVSDKVSEYAVVYCPNYINNRELGGEDALNYYVTTVDIDLYIRDKQTSQQTNQMNVKRIDKVLKDIMALFPIINKEKSVMIHNPRVIFSSSDGEGWHYVLITARLTTYINN